MTAKKSPPKRTKGAAKPATKARVRKTAAAHPSSEPVPAAMSDEEIALKAYFLWESRGRPHGSADEDWHRAKEQLGT